VDDLADRQLPAHVVVNGSAGAETLRYRVAPDTRLLLGPRYALVEPAYAGIDVREARPRVQRMFISLGGGAVGGTLRTVAAAADRVVDDVVLDITVGPLSDDMAPPLPPGSSRNRLIVHRGLTDLRGLMLAADVAVSGAGMTLYELAAAATPTVTVRMATNQRLNDETFARAGATLSAGDVGTTDFESKLEDALRRLATDVALRTALARRAHGLVDGRGALRVAQDVARTVAAYR
jgi:UDP-2,4-diacetamido-2,4,6-trideoxy-beta-L-altropyranose hydrolase